MTRYTSYKVLQEYDDEIHGTYKSSITNILVLFKTGMQFRPFDFAKENVASIIPAHSKSKDPVNVARSLLFKALRIAKRYKLVQVIESLEGLNKQFLTNNETVTDWNATLSRTNFQNIEAKQCTTASNYANRLRSFDVWLDGKSVTYKDPWAPRATHEEVKEITVTFTGIESMVKHLKKNRHIFVEDFIMLVEKFLECPLHDGLKPEAVISFRSAINSFFKYHKTRVFTAWKPSRKTEKKVNKRSKQNKRGLTTGEIADMLLLGSPTPRDAAILMIMFHRGLDKSTMCDRFNFQAWEQIVDWFGTEDWNKWDLSKVPVPIELERVKTDVESFGFLEKDAITCLQLYLDDRFRTTGTTPKIEEPLILSTTETALPPSFCYRMVKKLARNANTQKKLTNRKSRNGAVFDKITIHLVRHTLETIIENNVKGKSLADSCINHTGTYNDSSEITPEILRAQYATLAPLINVLSKMKNNINGDDPEKMALQIETDTLKNELIESNYKLAKSNELAKRLANRIKEFTDKKNES